MDGATQPQTKEAVDTSDNRDIEQNTSQTTGTSDLGGKSATISTEEEEEANMTSESHLESEVRPSIESDNDDEMDGQGSQKVDASEPVDYDGDSELGEDTNADHDHPDPSYPHSEYAESQTPHVDDGGDSSSHHDADEDVFSDKSPRSSLGSFDGNPEAGKKGHRDSDNMTTVRRSPRISDISQYEREYEKEEFVSTIRGTPRPPFRTPSDVRAMQMSSPPPSVLGSPRSTKRHFPTVSRLGTPNTSTQYSPKRMSTPQRFKRGKEAPLVLLHVTLLPLRWVWGDLLSNLDTEEMSDQVKSLRESWRVLQDRVGDTVIERGILLGHPQNDYEILEERLLEALELPLRRRARILECGHYLGPSNETTTDDEESEDEWSSARSRTGGDRRHWCKTCKNEIRYDSLGPGKIFRVKVYASNGLMRAGAWAACWKEMERVDVEIEPIVEPAVQEELVRLAAVLQERELAHQEEADIAKEVAHQLEEQHQKERAEAMSSRFSASSPQLGSERARSRMSTEERHQRDEERLREIYGHASPPLSPRPDPSREPSAHPHQDQYMPPPSPSPSSPSHRYERHEQREPNQQQGFQNASLPELMLQSVKVLMQDRKNVIIFTLSVLVLIFALRSPGGPAEPTYEPVIHRMRDMPTPRRVQVVDTTYAPTIEVKAPAVESVCGQPSNASPEQHTTLAEAIAAASGYYEASGVAPQQASSVESVESYSESLATTQETPESVAAPAGHQKSHEATSPEDSPAVESDTASACSQPTDASEAASSEVSSSDEAIPEALSEPEAAQENDDAASSVSTVYEPCPVASHSKPKAVTLQSEETETETVTEKKVVRVFHTVTEMETSTELFRVHPTDSAKQHALLVAMEDTPQDELTSTLELEMEEPAAVAVDAAAEDAL
ncbi:uncharacterized protein F4807DRAFT_407914 [Annulohypoxylon truncatum]|uniref:uncharacterized protein n=1 Tax=Annulohypoxylon truncatum TaxID=327061 RepID=UPI00200754F7|nr:uncharacterized protein F4807DRAFT_407914 [Annulohypoxylon truncatum]KAI1214402.1 hypothetical protein F4807DRAFT_407914 [Annulohypoxylon truncatum]